MTTKGPAGGFVTLSYQPKRWPALFQRCGQKSRPRPACFIGKEKWLHIERALSILKIDPAGSQNAGISLAHPEGSEAELAKLRPR
jgi:hypothetical protein